MEKDIPYQEVADSLRVPFTYRNLKIRLIDLQEEHYGSHCVAVVSYENAELFRYDAISDSFRTLKRVVQHMLDERVDTAARLVSITKVETPYR